MQIEFIGSLVLKFVNPLNRNNQINSISFSVRNETGAIIVPETNQIEKEKQLLLK